MAELDVLSSTISSPTPLSHSPLLNTVLGILSRIQPRMNQSLCTMFIGATATRLSANGTPRLGTRGDTRNLCRCPRIEFDSSMSSHCRTSKGNGQVEDGDHVLNLHA